MINRKVAREKIVEGHSTQPVHQDRSTYPPGGHCEDLGACEHRSIGGEKDRRVGGGYMHNGIWSKNKITFSKSSIKTKNIQGSQCTNFVGFQLVHVI